VATEVCSFLWKSSGAFDSVFVAVSIPLGLDCNWYSLVQTSKRLCKLFYNFNVHAIDILLLSVALSSVNGLIMELMH
jgi:hypothetical protein